MNTWRMSQMNIFSSLLPRKHEKKNTGDALTHTNSKACTKRNTATQVALEYFSFCTKMKRRSCKYSLFRTFKIYICIFAVEWRCHQHLFVLYLLVSLASKQNGFRKMSYSLPSSSDWSRKENTHNDAQTMLIRLNDKQNKNDTPRVNGMMKTIKSTPKKIKQSFRFAVHSVYVATKFKCFDYYMSWIQVKRRKIRIGNQIS